MDTNRTISDTESVPTAHMRAYALLGNAPGIKRTFGISLQAAHKWVRQIPVKRAVTVEQLTGVRAAELHPEVFCEMHPTPEPADA